MWRTSSISGETFFLKSPKNLGICLQKSVLLLVLQTCGKEATLWQSFEFSNRTLFNVVIAKYSLKLITKACKETIVNKHCTSIYLNCLFKTDQVCTKGNQTSVIKSEVVQKCTKYFEYSTEVCFRSMI